MADWLIVWEWEQMDPFGSITTKLIYIYEWEWFVRTIQKSGIRRSGRLDGFVSQKMCAISTIQYAQINKSIEPDSLSFRALLFVNIPKVKTNFWNFPFHLLSIFCSWKNIVEMRERTNVSKWPLRKIHFQQLQIVQQQQSINLSKWRSTAFYLHNTRYAYIRNVTRFFSLTRPFVVVISDFPIAYWSRTLNELYRLQSACCLFGSFVVCTTQKRFFRS